MKSFWSSVIRGTGRFFLKKLKKVADSTCFKWTMRILVAFGGFNLLILAYIFVEVVLIAFSSLEIGVDEWTVAAMSYIKFLAGDVFIASVSIISLCIFCFWAVTKIQSSDRKESEKILKYHLQAK